MRPDYLTSLLNCRPPTTLLPCLPKILILIRMILEITMAMTVEVGNGSLNIPNLTPTLVFLVLVQLPFSFTLRPLPLPLILCQICIGHGHDTVHFHSHLTMHIWKYFTTLLAPPISSDTNMPEHPTHDFQSLEFLFVFRPSWITHHL